MVWAKDVEQWEDRFSSHDSIAKFWHFPFKNILITRNSERTLSETRKTHYC